MYTCEVCLQPFTRKFNLQRHIELIHRKQIESSSMRKRPIPLGTENNVPDKHLTQNTHFGYGYLGKRRPNDYLKQPPFLDIHRVEDKDGNQRKQEYDNSTLKWKHPFTCMIAGPTGSGKSTFTTRFLKYLKDLVNTDFVQVVYCAPKSSYPDLTECETPVRYMDWIPSAEMFTDKKPRLAIIDDMMRETNEQVIDLFTKHSHHLGLSVIFITQNIFHKGKGMRDISLNSHMFVVYKSPRDRNQFVTLARQICPGNTPFANEVFEDATNVPYGYLVIDLTQTTPDHLRYRTNIFPDDNPPNIVYVPKNFTE